VACVLARPRGAPAVSCQRILCAQEGRASIPRKAIGAAAPTRAGAVACLFKPFSDAALLDAVNAALGVSS
jgi:hypothetical protein